MIRLSRTILLCLSLVAATTVHSMGCNVQVPSGFCGGLAGVPCNAGEYCKFDDGVCGQGDQSGACETIPDVCTEVFSPVCGCDGMTYSNPCTAASEGVSILSAGECAN